MATLVRHEARRYVVLFLVVGTARLCVTDIHYFALGRRFGPAPLERVRRFVGVRIPRPAWGPGRKHERKLVLLPWQEQIAFDRHADLFLRGLIHSDGWRAMNTVTTTISVARRASVAILDSFIGPKT